MKEYKPDFERITFCDFLNKSYYYNGHLQKTWEMFEKGDCDYEIKNNTRLIELLKEYDLLEYKNDILYITHIGTKKILFRRNSKEFISEHGRENKELLKAIMFLKSTAFNNVKITLKDKTLGINTSLSYPDVMTYIYDALLEKFAEDYDLYYTEITDEIIEKLYSTMKKRMGAGRRDKNFQTAKLIDSLQRYLNQYTHIKATANSHISNKQGRLIYNILVSCNIMTDKEADGEGNVRLTLKNYREKNKKSF